MGNDKAKSPDDCKENPKKMIPMPVMSSSANSSMQYAVAKSQGDYKENPMPVEQNSTTAFPWKQELVIGMGESYSDKNQSDRILTANDLERLAQDNPNLEKLLINGSSPGGVKVSDAALVALKKFSALKKVEIRNQDITGETLINLPDSIKRLNLRYCPKITNKAISQLASTKIKEVCVSDCNPALEKEPFFQLPGRIASLFYPNNQNPKDPEVEESFTHNWSCWVNKGGYPL